MTPNTDIIRDVLLFMERIELIVRAVIQRDDSILISSKVGEPNTFLPGGHVEYGEYSGEALERELSEELGIEVELKEFVGVLEYQYVDWDGGRHHHEVNFIYRAETTNKISPRENHLDFHWCKINQLEEIMLLPDSLPKLIKEYCKTGQMFHHIK